MMLQHLKSCNDIFTRSDRIALAELAERLWDQRSQLARECATTMADSLPSLFEVGGAAMEAQLAGLSKVFLTVALERILKGDINGLTQVFYEMNRRLFELDLDSVIGHKLSLPELYAAIRLGLHVIETHLQDYPPHLALAHSRLSSHLIMLVGLAYSDAHAEELKKGHEALEHMVATRTAELAKETALADSIFESLPGIFYLFDSNGRFLRWNRNFELASQSTSDQVAASHPIDYFRGDDRTTVAERIEEVFRAGQSTVEAEFVGRDGAHRPYLFTGRRVVLNDQVCLIGMGIDIAARKNVERRVIERTEELARSNADLEKFAYVASHDLQEPLRAVASYTELLARRYQDQLDDDGRHFIDRTVAAVGRMQALIHDLLAYSRIGTKGQAVTHTDCAEVVREVLDDLQTSINEAGAAVSYDPLPVVAADRSQLRQLLQNLIGNAIKFRGQVPARVRISAERDGEIWQFSVCDNGIGINAEYAERVFVIFQRLHSQRAYPGTGVGLAICKRIVERHGGRIWIAPQTATPGTTVCFTLPAEPPQESPSAPGVR